MFCGVQFSIFFPTLWPFLNKVDPTASETFFGIITAAFSVGQGLASPIFGFWMNRSKSVRWPMICGITVMIVSNVIFCFVEAFKEKERRWVMMVASKLLDFILKTNRNNYCIYKMCCRFFIGLGAGTVAFAPIGFPGWVVGPLHVDMFTAPAWFATLICILSLVLLLILLEENYVGVQEEDEGGKVFV
ncbi:unnamed protein product [Nippostrongylus brasiliensis]|uniref:MFS domain-containing protein n=1 Tax=Nippostrongylus brasiliensis TaxID=27835 RepID=A0A0N4YZK3_NIPBR|nr:unnamed protein product [Nippostrongylus brasiliensis]